MVGYVQSRGRARRPDSTYVVMIEEKANIELDKYYQLKHSERALDKMYQRAEGTWIAEEADSDEEDMDVDASEQYKVPSTGATLTSHSAIALLNYLCSIIPRDDFCPTIKAEYDVSGSAQGFIASVKLPSVLPIPRNQREHRGCVCGSRKAAKRSAAFTAARTLHMLGVFDDNLLPGRLQRGDGAQDADGKPISNTFDIPKVMEVPVRFPWPDPWRAFAEVWLHPVYVNGRASTGLVAGCSLETLQCVFETPEGPRKVSLGAGVRLQWPTEEARLSQLRVMEAYSISTIWWTISIGTMPSNHSYYLVPINGNSPDYRKMMAFMEDNSSLDWSSIDAQHEDALVVMDRTKNGQAIFLFKKLRTDLSPLSKPIPINGVCIEEDFESYLAYHTHKMRKMKHPIDIDPNEPILELEHLPRARNMSSALDRLLMDTVKNIQEDPKPDSVLLPRSLCRWIRIPIEIFRIMQMVPSLIRLITDISRARACRVNLNLPSVPDNLIVQALTLPSAMTGYSYQRLETLGDAVLKLATSVHIFNKFPHRHEGQLDILRMNSINNIYLLARARDHHLEEYLNTEPITIKHWKPFTGNDVLYNDNGDVFVQRKFARRSLPDCVEALLGASFLSGGMTSALATGTTLELCVGGPEPWQIRYKTDADEVTLRQTRVLFASLEEAIGYQFRNPRLLVEAVSHPSFHSPETPSYQRLEFLGDGMYF
jgi:endoribonuclease Dicer